MKIENSFTVDAPISEAWTLLTDIPEIAPCLPGAKLTGEQDGVYSGGIKVKVGPITAEYKGSAEFVEFDEAARKAVINGKGRDTRGAGNAQALITAQMASVEGDKTQVDIITDLKISGKVAQFGRGVMQDISEKLLGQFAECLEQKIGDDDTIDGVVAASAEATQAANDSESIAASTEDDVAVAATEEAPAEAAVQTEVQASETSEASGAAGDDDDGALDLLDAAGGAVFKRFIPVAVAGAVVLAIIIWIASR